jgi:formate dehydrogenase subunit gamma
VGEIVRYKRDVWGEEVILGVSWDLLWVVAVAVLVLLATHAIIMAALANKKMDKPSSEGRRVLRHETIDRLFHWVMAASILVTFVVVFHIIRSLFWQDFKSMILGPKDFGEPFDSAQKPGKYTFEQKGMHWAVTVVVLAVIATGILLFLQIDTPFWDRTNSMAEDTLGLMFLLHGLSTLALVALASTHIYFALRPEKLFYTRSMVSGWMSEDEMTANHDTSLWSPKEAD